MFEGVPYTVLGLGDTNYDKFCFMGKAIDKRLSELGGKRMMDLYCADESTNLEEVVEAWKIAVMDAVMSILPKNTFTIADAKNTVFVDANSIDEGIYEEIKNIELNDIAVVVHDNNYTIDDNVITSDALKMHHSI